MHAYIRTYMHTCIHTYTHTYILKLHYVTLHYITLHTCMHMCIYIYIICTIMFNSLPHTINTCLESFRHNCQEYSRIILSNIIIYYPHIFQQTGWHSNIFPPRCMKKSTQLAVGKAQRQNIEYLAFTEWKWEIGPVWKPGRSSEKKIGLAEASRRHLISIQDGTAKFLCTELKTLICISARLTTLKAAKACQGTIFFAK